MCRIGGDNVYAIGKIVELDGQTTEAHARLAVGCERGVSVVYECNETRKRNLDLMLTELRDALVEIGHGGIPRLSRHARERIPVP